MSKLITTRNKH